MSVAKLIKADERVLASLRRLKKTNLDLQMLQREMMTMHSARGSRALKTKKVLGSSAAVLVDATTLDMTYRSRCTEIRASVLSEKLERDEVLTALRKYIMTKFNKALVQAGFKNITQQKSYVDVLLESYTSTSRRMDHVLQIAQLISDDIDQSGWGLKLIKEVLEALSKERYA